MSKTLDILSKIVSPSGSSSDVVIDINSIIPGSLITDTNFITDSISEKDILDNIPSTPILKALDDVNNLELPDPRTGLPDNIIREIELAKNKDLESLVKNISEKVIDDGKNKIKKELEKTNTGTSINAVMNYLMSQKENRLFKSSENNNNTGIPDFGTLRVPERSDGSGNKIEMSKVSESVQSTPNKFKSLSLNSGNEGLDQNLNLGVRNTDKNKEDTGSSNNKLRVRKIDRKNLFSELCSELPITLKYTEGNLDGNDSVQNYAQEWTQWYEVDEKDELKDLIEELKRLEEKYKKLGKINTNIDKGIQFSLLVLGSGVVYVEASKASTEVISKWNIVAGALTTTATIVYNFFKFDKKGPHYTMTSNNLRKLRSWIEGKMILPINKRFSPFDIYSISFKAYQSILEEAASINQNK